MFRLFSIIEELHQACYVTGISDGPLKDDGGLWQFYRAQTGSLKLIFLQTVH